MKLTPALRVANKIKAALVGSGGKTTALFQLARELPPPVLVTASTHLGEWQLAFADHHWIVTRPEDVAGYAGQIEGVTLFTGPADANRRMQGLKAASLEAVRELAERLSFPVLIEADGSRQRAIKAPGEAEPVIPDWVDLVIVTAGLSGLGRALAVEYVHRADRFAALSGLRMGEPVSVEALAKVLTHREGGLKNIPPGTRKVLLLNQADDDFLLTAGLRVANYTLGHFESILISSLENEGVRAVVEPVAGVILAAGASSRFGQAKMLLPWRGIPIVRHVAEAALAGGLSPVVVVLGAETDRIRAALSGLPVTLVENAEWAQGQSTSVRTGVSALESIIGAAIFLLADQPFVSAGVIEALINAHRGSLAPVIAPRVEGRRANPVLFDRKTFPDLAALTGDSGGRAIFERYSVTSIDWDDPRLSFDIDTEDDYRRLLEME